MLRFAVPASLLLALSSAAFAACPGPEAIEQLRQQELRYLLEKVPPAFRHGVEDQLITLNMRALDGTECRAALTIHLPADDIAAGHKLMEADPAKRIMLFSQGYALPEAPASTAEFGLSSDKPGPRHADTLQTAPLGKLRASVELLYATLSQARAALSDIASNATPWNPVFRTGEINLCKSRLLADDADAACACRADGLARALNQRQMEYQNYIRANPYAMATGVGRAFDALESQTEQSCGLRRKS